MSASRRRICLVAPEFIGPFPNGGVGTACYWEATTLAAAGYDVTVLYTGPTDRETPEHWERMYANGPFTYVDLWRTAAAQAPGLGGAVDQPCPEAQTAELVLRFLRERSFDLLLFQEFLGHGARALQARRSGDALAGTPAAVTLHSCRQWIYEGMKRQPSSRQDLYVDFLERESARLADYVIAPSQHMAGWTSSRWHLPVPPAVVPYCYDERIESPAQRVRHEGPFTQLVFFGRLETRKGLHVFCRALADEAARGPVRIVTFLGKPSTVEGRTSEEFIRSTLGGIQDVEIRIIGDLGSLEALAWLERQRQTIVVAPSLVDNLPYAVIELFARRLPLISSAIGGIPEIVGTSNAHVLAEPTSEALAGVLSRAHREGHLTIDYRDGYSIRAANAAHLDGVREMIESFRPVSRTSLDVCDIVITDVSRADIDEVRERVVGVDPTAASSTVHSWEDWRHGSTTRPALFMSSDVAFRPGTLGRMLHALGDPKVTAVTGYFETEGAAVAPLGNSLEAGWSHNVFGGPCFAARGAALDVLRQGVPSTFRFWPAYAALSCAGLDVALVPEVLFSTAVGTGDASHEAIEAVATQYRDRTPDRMDLGWLVKYAGAAERGRSGAPVPDPNAPVGRALYERLLAIPDAQLVRYAGLTWTAVEDPFVREMRALRTRLAAIAARWQAAEPRVYMYGAGEHARLVLTLEPDLGRFIAGFIDRRPVTEYLGKPCVRPETITPAIADAVIYSSREFEREMYAVLSHLPIEHVLLYGEAPAFGDSTPSRLRRRLGHAAANSEGLRDVLTRRPSWVQGGISGGDSELLLELVSGVAPSTVLELGVASGASSAALLFALDSLGGERRTLHSCDVRGTCYFDPERATGSAVAEMYPEYRTDWRLDTNTDARRILEKLPAGSIDLTFIDANHSHPWPLLDLLHITRLARPGSWVALHDIELPRLHPQYQVYGPKWLFEAWPFNKIHGLDDSINIGAVQLPLDLRDLVPMSLALLERPWEHSPTSWHVDLPEVFREVSRALAPRLPDPARAA